MESVRDAGTGDQGAQRYCFGNIVVDALAHTIYLDAQPVAVEPKAFAVLLVLLRRPDQLIARDELLDAVWGHRHVTPGVLTRAITQLRAALADDPHQPRYIQTQHALGYRFIGDLQADDSAAAESATPAQAMQGDASLLPIALSRESAQPVPTTLPDEVDPIPLPYAGDERRGTHRLRRWQWLGFGVLALALLAWAAFERSQPTPRTLEPSIAVLPFTNLSDDGKDDYFAEGLASEMHDALAGVPGLKVAAQVSPTTVLAHAGDVKALGALLGVATVLEANVRRDGKRVRINARLSDCSTGYTLWSRSYDRQLADVFDTQVQIAGEAVQSLVDVLPPQRAAIVKRLAPTRNEAAFDAYLLGLHQLLAGGEGSAAKAAGYFDRAVQADAGFALAQAGLCRSEVASFRNQRDATAFDRARAACMRAKDMDAGLGTVNLALGDLYQAQGESGQAVAAYTRAQSDPASLPAAYMGLAMIHAEQGQDQQALELSSKAMALRPGDARIFAYRGYHSYLAGNLQDAIAAYRKAVALKPDDADYWSTLAALYVGTGDNPAATRALERSLAVAPGYAALTNLGELKYQAGDYAAAAALHQRATVLEPGDYVPWGNLGNALLADPAKASQARAAFEQAATLAQRYVATRPSDGTALAALGWFLANLGRASEAREMLMRSEQLKGEQAEIALYNAQTLALLGDHAGARNRIQAALAAGLPQSRLASNLVLRRAGLVIDSGAAKKPVPTTPGKS